METNGYELFYSCGGHGGPYWTLESARFAAWGKLRGMPTMAFVSIVERTPDAIGGYGRVVEKIGRADDMPPWSEPVFEE